MLILGLILSTFGIGLFCWLIFTLAVYALPSSLLFRLGLPHFTQVLVLAARLSRRFLPARSPSSLAKRHFHSLGLRSSVP